MPQSPLSDPSSWKKRFIGLIKAVPALILLFATLIVLNLVQTASLVLLPFSRKTFRAFNRWCANFWWGWCVSAARLLHGVRIEVTGDPVPDRENALVLANHQQMPDITFLMFCARSKDRLGDMKWFVKDLIKYVPGVGWGLLFLDCPFVKRNWAADRESNARTFTQQVKGPVPEWFHQARPSTLGLFWASRYDSASNSCALRAVMTASAKCPDVTRPFAFVSASAATLPASIALFLMMAIS